MPSMTGTLTAHSIMAGLQTSPIFQHTAMPRRPKWSARRSIRRPTPSAADIDHARPHSQLNAVLHRVIRPSLTPKQMHAGLAIPPKCPGSIFERRALIIAQEADTSAPPCGQQARLHAIDISHDSRPDVAFQLQNTSAFAAIVDAA